MSYYVVSVAEVDVATRDEAMSAVADALNQEPFLSVQVGAAWDNDNPQELLAALAQDSDQ